MEHDENAKMYFSEMPYICQNKNKHYFSHNNFQRNVIPTVQRVIFYKGL